MRAREFLFENPAHELAKKLPSLEKHSYNTIDQLMGQVAAKHGLAKKALHGLFVKTFKKTPDDWIKGFKEDDGEKLHEISSTTTSKLDIESEVQRCAEWAAKKLHLKKLPKFELSKDTEDAQDNHHTGSHIMGQDSIWVYVKNRNLVDILRTVLHELRHCQQDELGQIKDGDSYPGSPIEADADKWAGAMIKIWGEKNHHIFQ